MPAGLRLLWSAHAPRALYNCRPYNADVFCTYANGCKCIARSRKDFRGTAARNGISAPQMAGELLEEKLKETYTISPTDEGCDFDPDALERVIAQMTNRTPEEVEETRERPYQEM